jgi:hypothetical protein
MPLRCSVCTKTENVHVVCHHCGKPLCDEHKLEHWVRKDRAFVDHWDRSRKTAVATLKQLWPRTSRPEPLLVYHCKECKRQYHGRF